MLSAQLLVRFDDLGRNWPPLQHRVARFWPPRGTRTTTRRFATGFRWRHGQPTLPPNPAIVALHPCHGQRTGWHGARPRAWPIAGAGTGPHHLPLGPQPDPGPAVLPCDAAHLGPAPAEQIRGWAVPDCCAPAGRIQRRNQRPVQPAHHQQPQWLGVFWRPTRFACAHVVPVGVVAAVERRPACCARGPER